MAILSNVFGALQIPDDDYTYVLTFGQEAIYNALKALLGNHNDDLNLFEGVFVENETSAHTSRYYLDTGGRLSKMTNSTKPPNQKAGGSWDVAYPLEEFGVTLAGNRVQLAYMSSAMFGRNITSILNSDINTRRHEMLKRLFDNGGGAPIAFQDEQWGSLNIQPLANGDSTLFPPKVGAEINSTRNNYLTASYAESAISDTNDPLTPMVNLLRSNFGIPTGGSNIAIFGCQAMTDAIQNQMTLFNPIEMLYQKLGDNITQAVNWPTNLPGEVIGTFAGKCLLVHWEWIPDQYLLGIHLDAAPPLRRRIDPPAVGLGSGLQLIGMKVDQPIHDWLWSNRFGYACGNRLNGVITQLNQSGSYSVPSGLSATT